MSEKKNDEGSGDEVKDQRCADEEGSIREENTKDSDDQVEEVEPEGSSEINFSSFIMSLATQALMHLGEMAAPEGIDVQVDMSAAKQAIDIISFLEEKTKGNLDDAEVRLLTEILHNLRVSYLKVKG